MERAGLPLCELDDDRELVYEEVVCRVDDDGDVVEVSLVCEVLVMVVLLVLPKRTRQGRARRLRMSEERACQPTAPQTTMYELRRHGPRSNLT